MISFGLTGSVMLLATGADAGNEPASTPVGGGSGEAPVAIATIPSTGRTSLTSAERSRVQASVSKSTLVRDAVGDAKYSVDTALWSDDTGKVIGGVALIRLDRPITLQRGFPSFAPAPRDAQGKRLELSGAQPFVVQPAPFDASGVQTLSAFVDLRQTTQVVALSPDPSAQTVTDPEYLKTRPPLVEGGN